MPSSGSTTSRSASSTSSGSVPPAVACGASVCVTSAVSWSISVTPASAGLVVLHRLRGRVLPGHPAEKGALDPGRVLRYPGERDRVPEHVLVGLGLAPRLHEGDELAAGGQGVADRLADDQVAQDRHAGLADRAAQRVPGEVGHDRFGTGVLQRDPQGHLVTAGRVHVPGLGVVGVTQALVMRVPVVIEDDLLVQRLQLHLPSPHATWKNRCAWRIPSASASTSSRVVYRWNEALVLAWTPSARCSGQAQWCPARTATPCSSSTWLTSCGWTPSTSKEIAAPRPAGVSGPRIRTPSIAASPVRAGPGSPRRGS